MSMILMSRKMMLFMLKKNNITIIIIVDVDVIVIVIVIIKIIIIIIIIIIITIFIIISNLGAKACSQVRSSSPSVFLSA